MANEEALNYTKVVKAALEKQISKTVKDIRCTVVSGDVGCLWYGYCPICGNHVESDQKYCPECGQKLDWDKRLGATVAHFLDCDVSMGDSISMRDYDSERIGRIELYGRTQH